MLKYFIQYKFSLFLAIVISLLSLVPASSIPESRLFGLSFLDKIVHMGMYGAFSFTALLEIRCKINCGLKHFLFLSGIFLMSLLIEVLQATLVASRSAEWLDLLANLLGVVGGYVAYRIIRLLTG